jgi:hypothetical protein
MTPDIEVEWKQADMVEVTLNEPDDFLKVRETLTRIGVASRKEKKIYQSCHILHKQGKYYIVHFKELFALDGKNTNLSVNDVQRRNRIIQLLSDWGLITVVKAEAIADVAPLNQIKVLAFKEKDEWTLESKYNIGRKKTEVTE